MLTNHQNKANNDASDSSSEDDVDDEVSDEDSDNDPASELIKASRREAADRLKAERKANKDAKQKTIDKMARDRKKKDVNLHKLADLRGNVRKTCYNCGDYNHMSNECPRPRRSGKRFHPGGDNDGPPRKAVKSR